MAEHPKDNAPKDGTDILLWGRLEQKPAFDGDAQFGKPAWYVGQWFNEDEMEDAGWYVLGTPIEPTHWQPIPPPEAETNVLRWKARKLEEANAGLFARVQELEAAQQKRERCPSCLYTDLSYSRLLHPACSDQWHLRNESTGS